MHRKGPEQSGLTIRTPRLELVALTAAFVRDLTAGDARAAGEGIGALVSTWMAGDPSHVVQLYLAEQSAVVEGFAGIGRVIVLRAGTAEGRAIGSVGFSGPPDERGRMELACRIHPAYRGRAYGVEATTSLLDWASARFGVTRFLLAVPSRREAADLVPIEIEAHRTGGPDEEIKALAHLLEGSVRGVGRSP